MSKDNGMREKTYWRILGILTGVFVIMMGMINLLVIFFKHGTNYAWKKEFLIAEPLLAIGAVLTFFCCFFCGIGFREKLMQADRRKPFAGLP